MKDFAKHSRQFALTLRAFIIIAACTETGDTPELLAPGAVEGDVHRVDASAIEWLSGNPI